MSMIDPVVRPHNELKSKKPGDEKACKWGNQRNDPVLFMISA